MHQRKQSKKPSASLRDARRRAQASRRWDPPEKDSEDPPDPWACPRPDKRHHGSLQKAEERLAQFPYDPEDSIRLCACGRGWIWGRL